MKTILLSAISLLTLSSLPLAAATHRVVCLNTTGDAALINAAIASSASGDTIVIEGPALINAAIRLEPGRTYLGEGRTGTVIKQANGANLTAMLASASYLDNTTNPGGAVTISELTLDGNRTNNATATTAGIMLRNSNAVVDDLQIHSCPGDGIRISAPSANGTGLSSNQSYGVIQNCFIRDTTGFGIRNVDTTNRSVGWQVIDNWITNSGDGCDAIHVQNANSWKIERNHLYVVKRHGIYADRAYGTSISDNYVENFGGSAVAGTYCGISMLMNGSNTCTLEGNRVFCFNGGNVAGHTYLYLRVEGVRYGTATVDVSGNLVRGNSATATSTGLAYYKGAGTGVTVNHKANNVSNVLTARTAATGVTLVPVTSGW